MQTQTQTKTSILEANLSQLPLMKNFSQDQIVTKIDNFRKGEKGLYNIIKYSLMAVAAWAVWTYVLPQAFVRLGQALALVATGALLVFSYFLAPLFVKGVRKIARGIHKAFIKYDPFAQLEAERQKMIVNQSVFRASKGKIQSLKQDMEIEAKRSETEATDGQTNILKLQGKAAKIKTSMDEMIAKMGPAAKGEDDYVNLTSDLQKVVATAQQVSHKLEQSKDFVQKYGTRANIMKKMGQKLTLVETAMEIKISDFDATVEMLKKDYEFGQKSNAATTAAKSAMLFSKGWELDYALEVVTNTISNDIAITTGNLRDIDSLTANYSMDNDELYTNLEILTNKIKVGTDIVPSAKQYTNPEYKLTSDDKLKSGGFGEMF